MTGEDEEVRSRGRGVAGSVGGRLEDRAGGVSSEEVEGIEVKSKPLLLGAGDFVGSSPHSQEYSALGIARGGTSRSWDEDLFEKRGSVFRRGFPAEWKTHCSGVESSRRSSIFPLRSVSFSD